MIKIKNEQDYLKFSVYKYTAYHRVYAAIETTLHQMIYEQFKGGLRIIHLPQPFRIKSVSGQLPTYPSPDSTLTLACYQVTAVELGEG